MITFEQYIAGSKEDEEIDLLVLTDYREALKDKLFRFNWVYDKPYIPESYTVLASREIKDNLVYSSEQAFSLRMGTSSRSIDALFSYPILQLNFFYSDNLDLGQKPIRLFFSSTLNVGCPTDLRDVLYRNRLVWQTYNEYEDSNESKPIRLLRALESLRPIIVGGGIIDEELFTKCILQNKLKYQKETLTKRDYIRGAMMDL